MRNRSGQRGRTLSLHPAARFRAALLGLLTLAWIVPATAQDVAAVTGTPRVRIETSVGAFTVELDANRAPLSTANFMQYVRDRHYDGTLLGPEGPACGVRTEDGVEHWFDWSEVKSVRLAVDPWEEVRGARGRGASASGSASRHEHGGSR